MRYFHFKSKDECVYKTSFIQDEFETVKDARAEIGNNGDTSLEEWWGLKWDEEEQEWERELTHEEALTAALALDNFGDFKVREVTNEISIETALEEILQGESVAELPEVIAPSQDDFQSEDAYQQELNYIDSDIGFVEADIRRAISKLQFLDDDEKEQFRRMVWQHIDYKRGYTYRFPNLHPENISTKPTRQSRLKV
jgi:hypothetical protein